MDIDSGTEELPRKLRELVLNQAVLASTDNDTTIMNINIPGTLLHGCYPISV